VPRVVEHGHGIIGRWAAPNRKLVVKIELVHREITDGTKSGGARCEITKSR
jgi:hypothetical protein